MGEIIKGYKKRLATRRGMAKRLGPSAYYRSRDGKGPLLPRPLFTLIKMLRGWRPNETRRV